MQIDTLPAFQTSSNFAIDRRLPASMQVYEDLRAKIVALAIKPGEALSRPNLAETYGLSQTPVRDAFLKLQQEGLVEVYPQSRTMVTKIDVEAAREAQFLRTAIEVEIVRTLTLDTGKQKLAQAQQILSQQRLSFLEHGNLSAFSALDKIFHLALCTAAGHGELWDLVLRRSGHIDRLRNLNLPDPGKAAEILADHGDILQAIMASDLPKAEAAVRRHLSGTLAAIEQIRQRHPLYF
jgi:GntR family transcriptional regulator, rspAB operon transcriptional repressor